MGSPLDTAFDDEGDHLDELVTELAELAYERIADRYNRFPDMDDAEAFDTAMNSLLEDYDVRDEEQIKELVWSKLDQSVFTDAQESRAEQYRDTVAFRRNPLGYHGFRERDFL